MVIEVKKFESSNGKLFNTRKEAEKEESIAMIAAVFTGKSSLSNRDLAELLLKHFDVYLKESGVPYVG
jgi:hypothetical protein